jgi:hypothetical protein
MRARIHSQRSWVSAIAPTFLGITVALSGLTPGFADADEHEAPAPVDSDGDCIPNSVEEALGTNPVFWDSDGDFIGDRDEFFPDEVEKNSSCPVGEMEPVDTDGDEIPDILDADSDNDDIPDFMEAGDRSQATAPIDIDGDGVSWRTNPSAAEGAAPAEINALDRWSGS